jgi:hypothetical protein
MTLERDSDRRLRAWLSEGVDRAPERFVWAALDEIERTPQRPTWRTALERLPGRGLLAGLSPATGFAALALLVSVVLAIAILRVPSVGPRPDAGQFDVTDLPSIVVWQDTMPATWTLDNLVSNPTDVRRVPIRSMTGAQIDALPDPPGLLAGRYTNFSGPDSVFISWATLYERDIDAAAELPFVQHELEAQEAWGHGPPSRVDLGDEGYLYEGETTALWSQPTGVDPVRSAIYLWRDGNVLLAMGGWGEFDAGELRAIAQGMDQRAMAVSQGGR